jgi:hypothetical protein
MNLSYRRSGMAEKNLGRPARFGLTERDTLTAKVRMASPTHLATLEGKVREKGKREI